MKVEIKIPSPGESVSEVEIASWLKKDGEYVEKDEPVCSVESDKVTLDLVAEQSGELTILVQEGETIPVGTKVAEIDTDVKPPAVKTGEKQIKDEAAKPGSTSEEVTIESPAEKISEKRREKEVSAPVQESLSPESKTFEPVSEEKTGVMETPPAVEKPRISESVKSFEAVDRTERRKRLSKLRRKIAERLVAVKNQTAMLTTFNEIDMTEIVRIRNIHKEEFKALYNVGLGYMSFFSKAVVEALKLFPEVNARIEGNEIVYHDYVDLGIAVSTGRGLMVPVLRNVERLSFAEIESQIRSLAEKARENRISIDELTGGTFTITNGGVFGSLLSTPIINPPQSAILGMHTIQKRPVVIDDKVEIRPMMYVALSYDHRVIDGKESVNFLVTVKELLENPTRFLTGI